MKISMKMHKLPITRVKRLFWLRLAKSRSPLFASLRMIKQKQAWQSKVQISKFDLDVMERM